MTKMSEARLSRIDNLRIERFGFGAVTWPGLTDVRRLDLDAIVDIGKGSLTLYPSMEKPPTGKGLNKEAVVCLDVKPSRAAAHPDVLRDRLMKISEDFGGRFISYDMEKWIFRMPHFGAPETED